MNRSLPWALSLALFASGCSTLPPLPSSDVEVPQSFQSDMTSKVATNAAPTAKWWRNFHDPLLVELVEEAIDGNHELRLSQARLREARATAGVAEAVRSPRIDVTGTGGVHKDEPAAQLLGRPAAQTSFYQLGFDASWEIDIFGGVRASVAAAEADINAAAYSRNDVLVSLIAEVARNYMDLRGTQARLAVARRNIKAQSEALALLRSRVRAGLSADVDAAKAETDLQSLRSVVPQLEERISRDGYRLSVLLGKPPTTLDARLAVVWDLPEITVKVPVGLPSDLLARRPDVRAARAAVLAANARVGEARADLFPKFYLSGLLARAAERGDGVSLGPGLLYSVGPTLTLPILNGGRIRSNIAVQDARLDEALIRYEQTVLKSLEDVEGALAGVGRERQRQQSLESAVQSAMLAVQLAKELYGRGLSDYFAVIDAQRSLYAAEDALASNRTAIDLKLVALYKALGGGWETVFAPPRVATE